MLSGKESHTGNRTSEVTERPSRRPLVGVLECGDLVTASGNWLGVSRVGGVDSECGGVNSQRC